MNLKRKEFENWQMTYEMNEFYNKGSTQIGDLLVEYLIDTKAMVLPTPYSGLTFQNTGPKGGYGSVTSSMYIMELGDPSGYKPFGSIGQGEATDLGVAYDTSSMDRYMMISVIPTTDGFVQGSKEFDMTVGAYEWSDINLQTPVFDTPDSYLEADGAAKLAVGTMLAAMSLIQLV